MPINLKGGSAFLKKKYHGLIINRLLQHNSGSRIEWLYSLASFSPQTLCKMLSSTGRQMMHNLENVGLREDEMQGHDTLTYVHPSMDIFKAIFTSNDKNSDKEAGESGDSQEKGASDAGLLTLPQQPEEKLIMDADTRAIPHL